MEDERKEQLLQNYLDNKLTTKETAEFNKLIKEDNEFAADVQAFETLDHGLSSLGYQHLKNDVKSWEKEWLKDTTDETKTQSMFSFYSVAAVILILISVGIIFYYNSSTDPQELFAQNYTPYQDMILQRGSDDVENQSLTEGMQAYNMQQYDLAANKLNHYLSSFPSEYGAALYLGISQMELDNFDSSEQNLVLAMNDPMFTQQSQWYLSLLYLKSEQTEKAREKLIEISLNKDHYKSKEASDILEKLD